MILRAHVRLCPVAALACILFAGCKKPVATTPPPGSCSTNDDCVRGEECVSGACQLIPCGGTCDPDQICIAGECQEAEGVYCVSDTSRCPASYTCFAGTCHHNCMEDTDCPAPLTCDVNDFVCTQCSFDSDCKAAAAPVCDMIAGTCVGCLATTDCQPSGVPDGKVCDTGTSTCVAGCNTSNDCPMGPMECQGATSSTPGTCIQCEASSDCFNTSQPVCNTTTNMCVQCLQDSDCAGVSSRCDTTTNVCVECTHDLDCGDGQICSQTTFQCAPGCTGGYGDAVCPVTSPVCDTTEGTNGTCVQCLKDSDCQYMQICDGTMTCVAGCHTSEQCIPPADATPAMQKATICDPSQGPPDGGAPTGECVQCVTDSDCTGGLECDSSLSICRCKGIGEACTSTSQCGYSPALGLPDYGCSAAERTANRALCVTSIDCNEDPAATINISASVCVMAGMNQGLPDMCPNGSPGDPTGCPSEYVVELASDGAPSPTGGALYQAVCVPDTAPFVCMNTCF